MGNAFEGIFIMLGVFVFVMALWTCSIINNILIKQQKLVLSNQRDSCVIIRERG